MLCVPYKAKQNTVAILQSVEIRKILESAYGLVILAKVTRVIRTCLKAAYFGAFHPILSRKAPALLR